MWYSGPPSTQRVGLRTVSGTVVASVVNSAKPVNGVLVVNADERGPVEVLIDNGAGIELLVFHQCQLVPVLGPDDAPYLFDTGYFGNGTGAGPRSRPHRRFGPPPRGRSSARACRLLLSIPSRALPTPPLQMVADERPEECAITLGRPV